MAERQNIKMPSLTWRLVRVLLLLTSLLACTVWSVSAVHNTGSGDVGQPMMRIGPNYTLFVRGYTHEVLRATVRPSAAWAYEVGEVIEGPALDADQIKMNCRTSDSCTATLHNSTLEVEVRDDVLHLSFVREGVVLTRAAVAVAQLATPRVTVDFPLAKTLYGLAEHAADLALRPGLNYELYNTDAFRYPINSTKALYGSIPFVMAYSARATTGLLFLNAARMNIVLADQDPSSDTHATSNYPTCDWSAEVGLVDLVFMPGPTPMAVQAAHASLTGPTVMPPYFSLGYHQCRWNYLSTKDCLGVDEGFDQHDLPYDVLWLDIEHTDNRKYFTWNSYNFPDPTALTAVLASKGRKLVTIKDPHVKVESGYRVHDEATKGGHYVKSSEGADYKAHCWPGTSSWPDFLNRRTRQWYANFFHDEHYPGGGRDVHTWVDMNEPSVFNSPGGTMSATALHTDDEGHHVEHRLLHNVYGHLSIMSVYQGAREAAGTTAPQERPFILTRSFFAGTQRYAAMWTGDNAADWGHLANSIPELLSLSVSNYPFAGADIGGFFDDTEETLFVRWIQTAVFYPFMRAHSHIETRRREPWTYSATAVQHIRNALALRYALLPYLYTTFYHAHRKGDIVLRPLFYEFPHNEDLREEQASFMFGPSLLAHPVVTANTTEVRIPLPRELDSESTAWYDFHTGTEVSSSADVYHLSVTPATIPLLVRGGHTVPVKLRLRRSSYAARYDPFTLYVALDARGRSGGDVYLDDGTTFAYEKGEYAHRLFTYTSGILRCTTHPDAARAGARYNVTNMIERVVLLGYRGKLASVRVKQANGEHRPLEFATVGTSIVVRDVGVYINEDFVIDFSQATDETNGDVSMNAEANDDM